MKQKYASATVNVILPFCILLGAIAYMLVPHPALSQSGSSLTGFFWSETIGWVSTNCADTGSCGTSNYGFIVGSDGTLSGYGWSDDIGWVSANASDLTGCPTAPCTAKITGSALTGWLKALSGGSPQSRL